MVGQWSMGVGDFLGNMLDKWKVAFIFMALSLILWLVALRRDLSRRLNKTRLFYRENFLSLTKFFSVNLDKLKILTKVRLFFKEKVYRQRGILVLFE